MANEDRAIGFVRHFVREHCHGSEIDPPVLEYVARAATECQPGTSDTGWADTVKEFLQPSLPDLELQVAASTLLSNIHNPNVPLPNITAIKPTPTKTSLRANAAVFVPSAQFAAPIENVDNSTASQASLNATYRDHEAHSLPDVHHSEYADGFSAETDPLSGMACTDDQAVALLSSWFPSYSQDSLLQIYHASGCNLAAAVQDLTGIDQEAAALEYDVAPAATPAVAPRTVIDMSDFPTLSAASTKPGSSPPPITQAKSFAGAVKLRLSKPTTAHAAAPPAPQPSRPMQAAAPRPAKQPVEAPWVTTGDAVSREYVDARADARDLARLRNTCFQQATLAYLAGQKGLAKELSEKGRKYAEQMQAAHAQASAAIFHDRNTRLAQYHRPSGPRFLDLHGLHVAEAKAALQAALAERMPGRNTLYVIVGTGHHTKGSRTPARVPAAVEGMLQGLGLPYREIRPGMLQVDGA